MFVVTDQEEELLKALKNGNEEAFLKIYKTYWYKVFQVAYKRLRDKDIAEELTQDLFLKLWDRRQQLRPHKLANYLYVSIRNSVIDRIHSGIVAGRYLDYCKTYTQGSCQTTEDSIAFDDLSMAIEAGLLKLPAKTQEVFRLSRLNSWSHDKIARHLHLSEKTVGYHLTKSLKFMRTYLREYLLILNLAILLQAIPA